MSTFTTFPSLKFMDGINLLFALVIIYICNFYYKYFTRPNPIPGPFPLPLVGNLYLKDGDMSTWLMKLNKKYGDIFEVYFGKSRNIVLSKADYVRSMNKSSNFNIRMSKNEGFEEYGVSEIGMIFNSNMKSWKYNRYFFSQAISVPSFNDQALDLSNKIYNEMEALWTKLNQFQNGDKLEINLAKWMHAFTSDLIFEASTGNKGYSMHALYATICKEDLPEDMKKSDRLLKLILKFINNFSHFYTVPYWMRHYVPYMRSKTIEGLRIRDELFNLIREIINKRRKEIDNTPEDAELQGDLLTLLITANTSRDKMRSKNKEFTEPIPGNVIIGNILDTFIGGTDNNANLFCFIVYYISKNPNVFAKLRQEITSIFGDGPVNHPLTQSELNSLKYAEAIIKESNRLRPVIAIMPRTSSIVDEVAGYMWPANTSFFQFYEGISKNPYHWKDPEVFDPERFYPKNEETENNLLLFGGGIRICPGSKLALTELKSLMCFIFSKYDIELANPEAPLKATANFTSSCDGLEVKIKPKA